MYETITHLKNLNYPLRINRFLAVHKIATRRNADEMIEKGFVKINDRTASLGDQVNEKDIVSLKSNRTKKAHVYYAYNKPIGIVTNNPQTGETEIIKAFRFPQKVFAVGRLDKESHGLIIMTDDGRIIDPLLNPEKDHEKEYTVTVNKSIKGIDLKKMEQGLDLGNFKTKPCRATKLSPDKFSIILTEGKNHQIRRMCDALHYKVTDLKRTRIMNITMGRLHSGTFREIQDKELETFLASLGF